MASPQAVAWWALTQRGKPYVFGAAFALSSANPPAHDCSSLVQWACRKAGVVPDLPRVSSQQHFGCKSRGLMIPIARAIATQAALLIVSRDAAGHPVEPTAWGAPPARAHIAISLGDGRTIEARNPALGTNLGTAYNRPWSHAALIPGVAYTALLPGGPGARNDKPSLRAGTAGAAVVELQRLLIQNGASRLAGYGATGAFLGVTDEAVRQFQDRVRRQRDASMVVDGIAGPITWGWLFYLSGNA